LFIIVFVFFFFFFFGKKKKKRKREFSHTKKIWSRRVHRRSYPESPAVRSTEREAEDHQGQEVPSEAEDHQGQEVPSQAEDRQARQEAVVSYFRP
jgi:hypothetical protein